MSIGRGFIREEHPNCCICGEAMEAQARLVPGKGFAHPLCAQGAALVALASSKVQGFTGGEGTP